MPPKPEVPDPDPIPPFTVGDKVYERHWPQDYIGTVTKVYIYKKKTWTVEATFPNHPNVRFVADCFVLVPGIYPRCHRYIGTRKKCGQCAGREVCLGAVDGRDGGKRKHDRAMGGQVSAKKSKGLSRAGRNRKHRKALVKD